MKRSLYLVGYLASSEHAEQFRGALSDVASLRSDLHAEPLSRAQAALAKGHVPDILLLELDLNDEQQFSTLTEIVARVTPRSVVLATAPDATFEGVRRLMRLGVADFIPQPVSRAEVLNALEAAVGKLAPDARRGELSGTAVAFFGSCGGIGTTTLAVEAAVGLATRERKEETSVCLLDFDLQFGNAALSLDLHGGAGIMQILEAPSRLDASYLAGSMHEHDTGVKVLGAPESIIPLDALSAETAAEIVSLARESFDYVVIDLPHTWTSWTATVLAAADLAVMVTELNVTGLQRARRHLALIEQQGMEELPLQVLLNKFDGGWGWRRRRKQAQTALSRPIDAVVRADARTASQARDQGVPLRKVKRGSVIEKDLASFLKTALKPREAAQAGGKSTSWSPLSLVGG